MRTSPLMRIAFIVALACLWPAISRGDGAAFPKADGYRGIWFTLGQKKAHGDKYSGGLGTYTTSHNPLAIHARVVQKTFFVYGGAAPDGRSLHAMVGYFDHRTGTVPRPTVVHDKSPVDDPHDNPSLAIDGSGHVWVFVSGRARKRPGFVYRSRAPYDIDAFDKVFEGEMAYPQPWWIGDQGFLFMFTKYTRGRELYFATTTDGKTWSPSQKLAGMGGHYQMTAQRGNRIVSAFNMHPEGDVDRRTNLYFVQTTDAGRSWTTVDGKPLSLPLEGTGGPSLVRDYRAEGRLVYLCDVTFDEAGRPAILYITAKSAEPGPPGAPRAWTIARWNGRKWAIDEVAPASHNYDVGSLYIKRGGPWRIIAPTEPGPQPVGTGGDVAVWESGNRGRTWARVKVLTKKSEYNHSYVRRPVDAHPGFFAFWADGNPDSRSPSRLYFTDRATSKVWRLPEKMDGAFARPTPLPR